MELYSPIVSINANKKSLAPNPQGELSTYPEEGQRLLKAVSDQAALGEPFRLQLYK